MDRSNTAHSSDLVNKLSYLNLSKIHPLYWMAGLLLVLWYTPVPEGLSLQAWHLFAIFLTTIISIILNVLPMGALAVLAIAISGITETLTIKQSLSSFSSNIVWLILLAFLLARGFIKTGLGARLAYYFVQHMGKSTLGLAYGIISSEFLLAPFTPSNTARGAGILYPIVRALSEEYESTPQKGTERKIGAYLMQLAYQTNIITSAMFLTASSGNPLIVSLASKFGVEISWTTWALAALVPGAISLALLPWVLHLLYPAEIQQTPKAPEFAKQKLKEMGPLKKAEWIMLGTFGLLLTLWAAGPSFGLDPTISAFVGLAILLSTNVLSWNDILKEENAWHTFIWLTTLLMMSSYLSEFGMISWFGEHMRGWISDFHWIPALGIISLIYFYTHYAFASITAHISAMYSAFAVVAITTGAPPVIVVLILAFLSSLCAGITHYGTGTGPVYYGADYIKLKDWWRVGGAISILNLAIWMLAGAAWWKIIGLW